MGLRGFYLFFLFTGILGIISCTQENTEGGVYCFDCKATKPESGELVIHVTLNDENSSVPIVVYNDKYDPNKEMKVIKYDTLKVSKDTLTVPTNQYYSVRAEYKQGDRIIYAIDGGSFDAQKQEACDNTCWHILGGNYDLRLKDY